MFALQSKHQHGVAFGGNDTRRAIDVATAVRAKGGTGHGDFESETFVATTLRARDGAKGVDSDATDTLIAHSLRGDGFDASEDGTGRGTPLVAFDTTQLTSGGNYSAPKLGDPCHPLAAGAHPPAVAMNLRGRDGGAMPEMDALASLRAADGGSSRSYVAGMAVRRLTPRECERLQGFPDDYTRIPWRGRSPADCPDGPRYKALGNSMAVPVMRWIGERIEAVEAVLEGKG